MLAKLKTLREEREDGFTLIELLVVILIIGILSAIAIPVFLNQRKTANDSAVQSDMKNAAAQVETWITENGQGAVKTIDAAVITKLNESITTSDGVFLGIKGDSNNYCIVGVHTNGKNYVAANLAAATAAKSLTYENALGGMNKGVTAAGAYAGACNGGTFTAIS